MIPSPDRNAAVSSIEEAVASGACITMACKEIGIHPRTYKRWTASAKIKEDGRPNAERRPPSNQLTEAENARIVEILNSPEYKNISPRQIVLDLANKGICIASESSFYRVLRKHKQLRRHRGRSKPHASGL